MASWPVSAYRLARLAAVLEPEWTTSPGLGTALVLDPLYTIIMPTHHHCILNKFKSSTILTKLPYNTNFMQHYKVISLMKSNAEHNVYECRDGSYKLVCVLTASSQSLFYASAIHTSFLLFVPTNHKSQTTTTTKKQRKPQGCPYWQYMLSCMVMSHLVVLCVSSKIY